MGFYSVVPGSEAYSIDSPIVDQAVLHLENGKTFMIGAINQRPENKYVKKVLLNGKKTRDSF